MFDKDMFLERFEHGLYTVGTYEEPNMEIDDEPNENRMDGDNNENESE